MRPSTALVGSNATSPDTALVRATQIRLLYQNTGAGLKSGLVRASIILAVIRALGSLPTSVVEWGGVTVAWIGWGFILNFLYQKANPDDSQLTPWDHRAAFGCAVAGIAWASIGLCLLEPKARRVETLFIAIICLMAVGVYAGYTC